MSKVTGSKNATLHYSKDIAIEMNRQGIMNVCRPISPVISTPFVLSIHHSFNCVFNVIRNSCFF